MAAVTAPDEEESYLLAILMEADGLDLAEFSWYDPESETGCYRAWDFQWRWYTDSSVYQVDQGARALGKTVGITMRATAFPFNFEGQKMLLTAPELNHLKPLVDAIEQRMDSCRLLDELRPKGKGKGITKSPHWQARFVNGAMLVSRLPNKDGRGVKGCLQAQALVLTLRGQIPIEDVVVGDMVLTHKGRWRPVEATYHYADTPVVEVTGGGHRGLRMSETHDMLGRRNRNPQRTRNLERPTFLTPAIEHADEIAERWYLGSPTQFPELSVPAGITAAALRIAGAYVADGSLRRGRDGALRGISITDDIDDVDRIVAAAAVAGYVCNVQPKPSRARRIDIESQALASLLDDHFGHGAADKQIPVWLLGAPELLRRAFLDGYLAGDGHWNAKKRRWEMSTASKALAVGLRLLGQTLGYGGSLSWVDPKVTHIAGAELKSKPRRAYKVYLSEHATTVVNDDGVAWRKIRSVTPAGECDVYDLAVAEDHSYVVDGLISHNQHVIQIELDEAQDYPLAGWVEITETLNRGIAGAGWRCHGVPKGTRDHFWDITEGQVEGSDIQWKVHRPMAMHRPTWTPEERNEKIVTYGGSRQSIDYRRNIYGEHGDASNSVFVLSRLMNCVDVDEGSYYNQEVYTCIRLEFERLPQDVSDDVRQASVMTFFDLPGTHKNPWSQKVGAKEVGATKGYSAYWGGMDIGVTNHPSEILIYGQRTGSDHLDLLLRVHLQRINTDDQKFVIGALFNFYGSALKGFALDKTGVGFPIWDQLSRHPSFGDRIHGFNFSEKRVVAFDDRPLVGKETQKDLVIERNVVEASTDWLRNDYVDAAKMRLPYDKELLIEFQGQTYSVQKDSGNPYGTKRIYAGGSFHTLDAAKMVMAGKFIPPLEKMLEDKPARPPVLDTFIGMSY